MTMHNFCAFCFVHEHVESIVDRRVVHCTVSLWIYNIESLWKKHHSHRNDLVDEWHMQ